MNCKPAPPASEADHERTRVRASTAIDGPSDSRHVDRQQAGLSMGPEVRWRRQRLLEKISDGTLNLPALLVGDADESDEREAARISVARLTRAVPGLLAPTADRVLGEAGVGGAIQMRDMTIAARRRLAAIIQASA